MPKFHEYKWNNFVCQSWCLQTPKHKLHVGQRRVESTAATPREPQQLGGELLRWRLLQGTAAVVQIETSQLEVVIEGEVLEEVALGLHDAVELRVPSRESFSHIMARNLSFDGPLLR